jgi:hypothetical protein
VRGNRDSPGPGLSYAECATLIRRSPVRRELRPDDVSVRLGGFVLLFAGGEWLVRGAVSVSRRMGISPLLIGMTIVAFCTSAPELLVSLEAALRGQA